MNNISLFLSLILKGIILNNPGWFESKEVNLGHIKIHWR